MANLTAVRPLSPEATDLDAVETHTQPISPGPGPTLIERIDSASSNVHSAGKHAYESARIAIGDALERGRRNIRRMADEKPMQLLLGIAAASILAGVGLRLWRRHYE